MPNSPIKTRSNNGTSNTTQPTLVSLQKQPTINDIMKAILNLKNSHAEILTSNSKIANLQSSQFAELKKNLKTLSNSLNVLQAENASLRTELSTLKNKVLSLESNNKNLEYKLIDEMYDRQNRAHNIIIFFNLPENNSNSNALSSDDNKLKLILNELELNCSPTKLF